MHQFPRNSVELGDHESVITVSTKDKIKTVANKSLSLRSVAIVLAACALMFLGVMAVAHLGETSKEELPCWKREIPCPRGPCEVTLNNPNGEMVEESNGKISCPSTNPMIGQGDMIPG